MAASLYKLGIIVEVYRLREAGQLAFDDRLLLTEADFAQAEGESFQVGDWVPSATYSSI